MDRQSRRRGAGPDGRGGRAARRRWVHSADAVLAALGEELFELRFTLGTTARWNTYRFTADQRIILPTTFRKQRNNERNEITRARAVAADYARRNP